MNHECSAIVPDTVEITFNEYARAWEIKSYMTGFSDFSETSYFDVTNKIVEINFCPYCGERLGE